MKALSSHSEATCDGASDVFEIGCWNGERVRVAFSMDCADREVLSYIATTGGINGDIVRDLMAEAIE